MSPDTSDVFRALSIPNMVSLTMSSANSFKPMLMSLILKETLFSKSRLASLPIFSPPLILIIK